MGTTVKVRENYQVTIPEDVRNKIPLKVGERVEVNAREGEIVIPPGSRDPQKSNLVLEPGMAGADCSVHERHWKRKSQGFQIGERGRKTVWPLRLLFLIR